jgi:hypothetical protein
MLADYLEQIGLDPVLKQVYLEVEDRKPTTNCRSNRKSNATVTGKTKRLEELDLIELVRYNNSGKYFNKRRWKRFLRFHGS